MTTLTEIEEGIMCKIKAKAQELYSIWDTIGLNIDQKKDRCKTAWQHLYGLAEEILAEEKGYYMCLVERIDKYSKEILELSQQLSVPHIGKIEGTLVVQENILRKEHYDLTQLKQSRVKKFDEFRCIENKFCTLLGWKGIDISSTTGVPNENDLKELDQYINVLKKEAEKRFQRLRIAKKELTTIWEETELQPESSFEKEILSSKDDFSLTNETFLILDQVVQKVKSRKANLENERKTLVNKLNNLWERLKVPESEKKSFLSKHSSCKISTLNSMKEEIDRCEEIKKQNLKMYISSLRDELQKLWDDCFISKNERENIIPIKSDDFTEDNLKAHESEVEKWREMFVKTEDIRKKIKKRDQLWDLLTVFENKACDPNRFKNRGGNLLQEERDRKKLQRDLPTLENEIFTDLEKYEEKNGSPFLYYEQDYRVFISQQWEERNNQKENEKQVRHKQRTKQMENEMTLGTPGTKRLLSGTPKSAPSKFLKSSVGLSVYTPLNSCKKSPCTVGKQSARSRLFVAKALTPQNAVTKPVATRKKASPNVPDDTTYSAFAKVMNNSSKNMHRSSVLTSKKIVGTRLSNKSKRKSSNKTLRRSIRNKSTVNSKLTPARGNLGLPFLI